MIDRPMSLAKIEASLDATLDVAAGSLHGVRNVVGPDRIAGESNIGCYRCCKGCQLSQGNKTNAVIRLDHYSVALVLVPAQ